MKKIYVKSVEDTWVVSTKKEKQSPENIFTKTSSKKDAVRYARTCEQRTGVQAIILK